MILSGESIKNAIEKGELTVTPFEVKNLKEASYTFTLDSKLLLPKDVSSLKIDDIQKREEVVIGSEGFDLNPGDFVLGYTAEHLSLKKNFACFLSTRGSCAQAGLSVLLGSDFAEPDTDNPQMLEIHNVSKSPIKLEKGMKIVKGIFVRIDK